LLRAIGFIRARANNCRSGGLSHIPDLLQQANENVTDIGNAYWQEAIGALIEPAHSLVAAINEGLEHAGLQLGVIHTPLGHDFRPGSKDTEFRGDATQPGDPKFAAYLEGKMNEFAQGRLQSLSAWTSNNGNAGKVGKNFPQFTGDTLNDDLDTPKDHRQLNLVLYTHQMVSGIWLPCSTADVY
jgi:hypothetical protein